MDDLRLGDRIEIKNTVMVGDMATSGEWNEEGELIGVFWTSAHVRGEDGSETSYPADKRGQTWRKKGEVPGQLSEHFTWHEATYSDTAYSEGIVNTPSTDEAEIIKGCCAPFMEQVRAILGHPIIVTSWFRCEALNSAVGGSSTSEHRAGRAVDFTCPGFGTVYDTVAEIAADQALPFNQLIYENHGASKWVHLSCAAPGTTPKRQVLTIDSYGTHNGLIAS